MSVVNKGGKLTRKLNDEELKKWCQDWEACEHDSKVEMCQRAGITYDTGKHRYSDAPAELKNKPKMQVSVVELLEMSPSTCLDFVSFDLETSNLEADFSIVLSAVIKPYGKEPIVFRADDYPTWKIDRANDKPIIEDIARELCKHAIVITHYGMYFDIPFLRFKMTKYGLSPLPPMFGIDTWHIAKKNFKVSSRRLKNLVAAFDIGEKGSVEGGLWMSAAYNGDKNAMDAIVSHNIIDCEVLEKLACISFPYLKSIPRL